MWSFPGGAVCTQSFFSISNKIVTVNRKETKNPPKITYGCRYSNSTQRTSTLLLLLIWCVYQCHVEAEGTFWHLLLTQTFLMCLQLLAVSRIFRHVEQMACHNVVLKSRRALRSGGRGHTHDCHPMTQHPRCFPKHQLASFVPEFNQTLPICSKTDSIFCLNVTKYHRRFVAKTSQRNVDPVNNDRMHGAPKGTCSPGGAPRAMTEIG